MGQCYSVDLFYKIKPGMEDEFVKRAAKYLTGAGIREDCFDGEDLTTPEGCVKFVLAEHQHWFSDITNPCMEPGWKNFKSYFDASYSWSSILEDWFSAVAPTLEDDSFLSVDEDEGSWERYTSGGIAA